MKKSTDSIKQKILRVGVYYISIKLLILFITWLYSFSFLNFISFEHLMKSDVSINDLHYRLVRKSDKTSTLSNKLILFNTGDIPDSSFRSDLAQLINKLQAYNPKVIGIDHQFAKVDTNSEGTLNLKRAINGRNNIIIGYDENTHEFLNFHCKKAIVNFPDHQISIRKYNSNDNTFSFKIYKSLMDGKVDFENNEKEFFIKYVCDTITPYQKYWDNGLCAINSKDILNNNSAVISFLKINGKGKAFLIGNLGQNISKVNNYDTEDKHKVPCDDILVNRDNKMYGLLIHANAIENMLSKQNRFYEFSNSFVFKLISQLCFLFFIYFCLYISHWKLYKILFLFVMSVPFLFLVLWLMNYNIYIESGLTLLEFLVIEEFIEILHPIENKLANRNKK